MARHEAAPRMASGLALLVLLVCCVSPASPQPGGFLSGSLPLTAVITTPVELSRAPPDTPVTLSSRQALQVVFSRPVIALGSDFGSETNFGGRAPFNLTCNVPGRFRWVTTAIARLDPSQDWPTDLDCSLEWNTSLTSYDGLTLQLGSTPQRRRLVTQPLSMYVTGVSSARADNLTGGLWSATVGAPWDGMPEVPPDGRIRLSFSYPVNLTMLASALRLESADGSQGVALNVSRCQSPVMPYYAYARLAVDGTQPVEGPPLSLDYIDSCAQVTPAAPLDVAGRYKLYLPSGARYHPLAGPVRTELSATVYGLRKFLVPLKQDFQLTWSDTQIIYDGARYRRLDLWLPHGLSPETPISRLADQIRLCQVLRTGADKGISAITCEPVAFNLSLPQPGLARLTVPTLQPRSEYRLSVEGSSSVIDGFGLPLEASAHSFWSTDTSGYFTQPGVASVSLFETGADGGGPVVWPILAASGTGDSLASRSQPPDVSSAAAWPIRLNDDTSVTRLVNLLTSTRGVYVPDVLGRPSQEVRIPTGLTPAEGLQMLNLTLDRAAASLHVVHTCCSYQRWTSPITRNSATISAVAISRLTASVVIGPASITAWVTNTSSAGPGPVEGATVWLFINRYSAGGALPLGKCTTDAGGSCTVAAGSEAGQLIAVVVKSGDAVVLTDAGYYSPPSPAPYIGTLVADRLLVRPGEVLHLTGYVQRQATDLSLSLPEASTNVSLQISRGWDPLRPDQTVSVPATYNATAGSIHVNVLVPASGVVGQFTFTLLAPLPPGAPRGLLEQSAQPVEGLNGGAAFVGGYDPTAGSDGSLGYSGNGNGGTDEASSVDAAWVGEVAWSGEAVQEIPDGTKMPAADAGSADHADAKPIASLSSAVASSSSSSSSASLPTFQQQQQQQQRHSRRMQQRTSSGTLRALSQALTVVAMDSSSSSSGRTMLPVLGPPQTDVVSITGLSITVADPRPPTAELSLVAPRWTRPNASVPVSVTCTSLIGSSVSLANVTLTWNSGRGSGLVQVITDAAGAANTSIDLSALPPANATRAGDTLTITAQWVGPTRELIVQTASVALQDTSRSVSLARQPETDIPGVQFALTARVINAEDGATLPEVPIQVSLTPSSGGSSCPGGTITGAALTSCTVVSGQLSPAACQLALPCVGEFNLTACTSDGGERTCTTVKVGRNESAWAATPLTSSPAFALSLVNASNPFQIGDTVSLGLQVPRADSSLLLVWGNARSLRNRTLPLLPAGPTTISLVLGDECRGGCSVAVLLSAPRLAPTPGAAPPVPTSALFDPLRPLSGSAQLPLNVLEARTLNVSLSLSGPPDGPAGVASAAPGAGRLTVPPGTNVTVSVAVLFGSNATAVPGTEITVIAVDKAVLQLLPYPLQDVSGAMQQRLPAGLSASDAAGVRVGAAGVLAAAAAAARRYATDPWVAPDYQCVPQPWRVAPVDIPDDQYLASSTTALTYMPSMFRPSPYPCPFCFESSATAGGGRGGMTDRNEVNFGPFGLQPRPTPSAVPDSSFAASDTASNGKAAASSPSAPRLQSDFVATPLFAVARVGADGTASVSFPAPSNLGTFVVRAYAAEGSPARYGSAETEMIVRRPLSLTPSLPRFARVGDAFAAGVIVTAPGLRASDGTLRANVTLSLAVRDDVTPAPLVLLGSSIASVSLTAGAPQAEVQFSFSAPAIGTALLTFTAIDALGGEDSVQLSLDVREQQGGLVVATSFPVRGSGPNSTSDWQEGLALPDAVPGSGGLELSAGVGHLPALTASYAALAKDAAERSHPSGYVAFALATRTPAAALYRLNLSAQETGEVSQAVSDLLGPLNGGALGLLESPPNSYYNSYYAYQATNVPLNAWAAWLASSWPKVAPSGTPPRGGSWASITAAAPGWAAAAARQVLADAAAARRANPPSAYSDFYSLAWVRLAMGPTWQPVVCGGGSAAGPVPGGGNGGMYGPGGGRAPVAAPVPYPTGPTTTTDCAASQDVVNDLSLARLLNHSASAGLNVQLLAALILQQQQQQQAQGPASTTPTVNATVNATAPQTLTGTLDLVLSSIRVIGRTAYVSAEPGGAAAADLGTQALALMVLLGWAPPGATPAPRLMVQKLAAHVAQGGGASFSPRYAPALLPPRGNPFAAALAARALAAYDASAGSTTPDLSLQASVGNLTVLNATFASASPIATPLTTFWGWGRLPRNSSPDSDPSPLYFQANGTGEASIAAVLSFIPRQLLPFPTYRGIWVEAAIQATDPQTGSPVGPNLRTIPLSSIVAITLQLTTPDDLSAVTVEAMMPAGLEPVDPNLAAGGTGGLPGGTGTCGLDATTVRQTFWWWWWPVCPVQETLPAVVTLRYQRLTAGTWSVRLLAVAATPGTFVLPPIKAYVDQQPEVMGMTGAGHITVCQAGDAQGCEFRAAPPPVSARDCPSNCSGNGACRLDTGTCVCSPNFEGNDCSQAIVS